MEGMEGVKAMEGMEEAEGRRACKELKGWKR